MTSDSAALGEIVSMASGKSIRSGLKGPVPVFGSNGIIGGTDEALFDSGVIVGRVGAYCGSVTLSARPFWASDNTIVVRPLDRTRTSLRFLSYALEHANLNAHAGGAAQPLLTQRDLRPMQIWHPSISTQCKIAAILSAYDELVENNSRRVRLLTEMGQRIYREWFVDFRYPGRDGVPLVDSELGPIPEGWEASPMAAVADVIDCLHSKKPTRKPDGAGLLLQLSNIGDAGVLDLTEQYLISASDYEPWTSRIEVRSGDCVVTNVGRIGAVAQIPEGVVAALGRNMTAIRPKPGLLWPTFLIEYLLSPQMEREIQLKKDAGAVMDSLNVKGIVRLAIPIPDRQLAEKFEDLVRPIRRKTEVLVLEGRRLQAARDLLLPRLMSGEVDVDDLDVAVEEQAA